MNQTKLTSLVEVLLNVLIGFIVAILIGEFIIMPLYAPEWPHGTNAIGTIIYTVFAVIRGYIVRRFFNANIHLLAVNFVRRIK